MSVASEACAPESGVTRTSEFDEVLGFIKHGRGNLFVTGRAGTGKSTLLREIERSIDTPVIVGAPTGIAALNVGGETLHSLFRLPHGLLLGADQYRSSPRDVFELGNAAASLPSGQLTAAQREIEAVAALYEETCPAPKVVEYRPEPAERKGKLTKRERAAWRRYAKEYAVRLAAHIRAR